MEDGFLQPHPVFFSGEFYGADIEVDAILSYPWMRENGLGIFPIGMLWLKTNPFLDYSVHGKKTNHPKPF